MYKLNPNLKEFWRTRKPYKLLKGGRFSGKTHDAAGMAAFLARNYSVRFLCIRQFQNRISDSVYTVVKEKIEAAGWQDEFDIGVSSIRHKVTGSEFLFYGMARNLNDIKGTEGVDICWIEEGEGLTEVQWSVIDPTIRASGSETWILWNPDLVTDFVQTKLPKLLGDDCLIRHINYPENPFLSDTARRKAERLKAVDLEAYNHIYLGIATNDDDSSLIKRSWIESAVNAHEVLGFDMTGLNNSALDVADLGKDENAQSFTDGLILRDVQKWKGKVTGDIYATVERAFDNCTERGIYGFLYDADGMGAGVRGDARNINEDRKSQGLDKIEVSAFYGSGEVIDKDEFFIDPVGDSKGITNGKFFSNYKAQSWWDLRERFRKTHQAVTGSAEYDKDELISIDANCSHLEDLKDELARPRKKKGSPKMTVDKAPDDMPSPNLADAVMMVYAPREKESLGFLDMDWS
jgi:phage terminase large subunit